MTPECKIANAIHNITATIQRRIDAGERSAHIDAHDLVEVLLCIAEEIDPDVADEPNANDEGDQP